MPVKELLIFWKVKNINHGWFSNNVMSEILFPKVSIIIPVYNVQVYLQQCLDSIINQSLRDIEIILVDDGSTDASGKICDDYAEQDNRIVVIHECNKGLSYARNIGIKYSTAPFLMFVDGDDWVEAKFCELPYKAAMDYHSDMVLITHNVINQDGNLIMNKPKMREGLLSEEEAMYYNTMISNAAWLALYSRHLFDNIRFPEGRYYEDVGIIHRLIHKSKNIFYLEDVLYNHRIGRKGSITTESDIKKHQDFKDMHKIRIEDLLTWGYYGYARKLAFIMLLKYGTQEKYFADIVRKTRVRIEISWKQRIMLLVFNIFSTAFDYICTIVGKRDR